MVHRDIKPANILISSPNQQNGQVTIKLGDFGLSRPTNTNGLFTASDAKGTLDFMAPEVLQMMDTAERQGTNKSDVFSSGLVFFATLTRGQHPFASKDAPRMTNQNILQGNAINIEGYSQKLAVSFAVSVDKDNWFEINCF